MSPIEDAIARRIANEASARYETFRSQVNSSLRKYNLKNYSLSNKFQLDMMAAFDEQKPRLMQYFEEEVKKELLDKLFGDK